MKSCCSLFLMQPWLDTGPHLRMMMLTPSRKGVAMTSTLLSLRTASLNFRISEPSSSVWSVYGRPCSMHTEALIRHQWQRHTDAVHQVGYVDMGMFALTRCTFMRVLSAMMAPPGTMRLLSMSCITGLGYDQPPMPMLVTDWALL